MTPSTRIFGAAVAAAVTLVSAPPLWAQREEGISARGGLEYLGRRFGEERLQWIVEMRGFDGIPEPSEWEVYVFDEGARHLIREYWVGIGEATNEGASNEFFPDRSPFGYFRISELKLDSRAAFTVAEGEARKARMGFDKLNYTLRCREFSREPVWTLELVDAEGDLVGKVYISGDNGEVLRTVWIYRGSRGRPDGGPLVVDSAAPRPGGGASEGARSQSAPSADGLRKFEPTVPDPLAPPQTAPTPGKLPPMPNLEPAPEPSPTGVPKAAPGPGVPDTRIPPPPATPGIDTRIPPPPIPPAP